MSVTLCSRQLLVARQTLFRQQKLAFSATRSFPRSSTGFQNWRVPYSAARWFGIAGVSIVATSAFASPISCESTTPARAATPTPSLPTQGNPAVPPADPLPPPPKSSVNLYQLSFGTVAGICAGVFIKKGVKAVAFFVGGIFVLLQYFNSLSLVRVDWARAGSKFENLFYTTEATGDRRPPTVVSLWRWLVDFLTADFQPRASFLAGLALGIRIG